MSGQGRFSGWDFEGIGEFEDSVAGNSFEDSRVGRWGEQLASLYDEDVIAGAFGDFPFVVEHDRFHAPGL